MNVRGGGGGERGREWSERCEERKWVGKKDQNFTKLFKNVIAMRSSTVSVKSNILISQVALVSWTEEVGLTLVHRDLTSMRIKTPAGQILVFNVLQIFPFTSETKRMGIIVKVWKHL